MADKDSWDWKEWGRALVIVWGAAGILGGLSHPPPQIPQPVAIIQVSPTQANEAVHLRFFKLADSLESVNQRLNKFSPEIAVVAEIRSISKRLDKLPDIHPCGEAVKKRIDTLVEEFEMIEAKLKKKDDPKREDIERTQKAVSEVIEVLKSLCE